MTKLPATARDLGENDALRALLRDLEALEQTITAEAVFEMLVRSNLELADVDAFAIPKPDGYSRRRVVRSETYEVLVMTWLPGQGSGAHDHAGSVSVFKVLCGTARETHYALAADGLVDPTAKRALTAGDVGIDADALIHGVYNDASSQEPLVSIHIYVPPIAELRKFTARSPGTQPAAAVSRRRMPEAPVVAIVGGGFSGAMVAAQLLRTQAASAAPLHLVVVDRQTSIAEGAAYRTPDSRHLLNVPVSGMSAWPDDPDHLLRWARQRDAAVGPYTFLQRHVYGEYLRTIFFEAIAATGAATTVELRRAEARHVERTPRGWRVHCGDGAAFAADVLVLATGHRPPTDPLKDRWVGSRARYIEDPWSSLALTAIDPHESVCLLGTGLTAMDVVQCLFGSGPRSAVVTAISRRGLKPAAHADTALTAVDSLAWLEPLLQAGRGATIRALCRSLRAVILTEGAAGTDWREVVDGLRLHLTQVWQALSVAERARFLRHARPFWEIARHRMAPVVARQVEAATAAGAFSVLAARVLAARATVDGVSLTLRRRGAAAPETLQFDWIINCTGPGSGADIDLPPLIGELIGAGLLSTDSLGLGVHCDADGRALSDARASHDLFVIGSLRKADVWESTAVPELRVQAAQTARAILARLDARAAEPARLAAHG